MLSGNNREETILHSWKPVCVENIYCNRFLPWLLLSQPSLCAPSCSWQCWLYVCLIVMFFSLRRPWYLLHLLSCKAYWFTSVLGKCAIYLQLLLYCTDSLLPQTMKVFFLKFQTVLSSCRQLQLKCFHYTSKGLIAVMYRQLGKKYIAKTLFSISFSAIVKSLKQLVTWFSLFERSCWIHVFISAVSICSNQIACCLERLKCWSEIIRASITWHRNTIPFYYLAFLWR